jgi:hypothetical protein
MLETGLLVPYKKLLVIFFLITLSSVSFSQIYPDHAVDSLLKKGINEIIKQNYDSSNVVFENLKKDFPQLPLGKIYLAANKIAQAYDYGEPFDNQFIQKNLSDAIDQSKSLIEKSNKNIWDIYFMALSQGYYAYYEALDKNWVSALNEGLNSISNFNKCLSIDSAFYEADLAIGTFKYWKSRKTEILNFLPIFKNEEVQGIELLKMAIDHSSYNKYLAMNSLIWIYIEQKKYTKAQQLAKYALEEFPDSRLFKWGLARSYEADSVSESIKIYYHILNSYNGTSLYNYILIKHIIAQQYYKLGDYGKALKLCNAILSVKNIPKYLEDKLEKRIERVKRFKKKLQKELSK